MTIALDVTPKNPSLEFTQSKTWHNATWDDYVALRDDESIEFKKISFHKILTTTGWLWVDMSHEGIDHSRFSDLMTMIFYIWKLLHPVERLDSLGRCLIECPDSHGCSPDLVLYKGGDRPIWKTGEPRRIDLTRHRLPDLVGEIADTSLRQDLTDQKKLYESLGISEYWVINVKTSTITAFQLDSSGHYQPCLESGVLPGLPIELLEQTIALLATQDNTDAAEWFREQLTTLRS